MLTSASFRALGVAAVNSGLLLACGDPGGSVEPLPASSGGSAAHTAGGSTSAASSGASGSATEPGGDASGFGQVGSCGKDIVAGAPCQGPSLCPIEKCEGESCAFVPYWCSGQGIWNWEREFCSGLPDSCGASDAPSCSGSNLLEGKMWLLMVEQSGTCGELGEPSFDFDEMTMGGVLPCSWASPTTRGKECTVEAVLDCGASEAGHLTMQFQLEQSATHGRVFAGTVSTTIHDGFDGPCTSAYYAWMTDLPG